MARCYLVLLEPPQYGKIASGSVGIVDEFQKGDDRWYGTFSLTSVGRRKESAWAFFRPIVPVCVG